PCRLRRLCGGSDRRRSCHGRETRMRARCFGAGLEPRRQNTSTPLLRAGEVGPKVRVRVATSSYMALPLTLAALDLSPLGRGEVVSAACAGIPARQEAHSASNVLDHRTLSRTRVIPGRSEAKGKGIHGAGLEMDPLP